MDKGFAGDSEKEALYVHIRPPLGAELKGVALRGSLLPGLRPAPRALLRVVAAPPGPLGCAPCALAHGPRLSADQKGGGCSAVLQWEFLKKRRRPGQLECVKRIAFCTRKASVSSVGNSRTRRAVHTLGVWAGELSMRGKGMNSAPAFAACEELKEGRTPL